MGGSSVAAHTCTLGFVSAPTNLSTIIRTNIHIPIHTFLCCARPLLVLWLLVSRVWAAAGRVVAGVLLLAARCVCVGGGERSTAAGKRYVRAGCRMQHTHCADAG